MRIRIQTSSENGAVKASGDNLVATPAPAWGQFRRPVRSWATEFERFDSAGAASNSSENRDRKDESSKNRK